MLKIGELLPEFEAKNQNGKLVISENLKGKKLIIFFFPKANTPTCTVEACNISDNYSQLKKEGFNIIGVSGDSIKKQKNFHQKFDFPFDLLSDETLTICNTFGVWKEKQLFGKKYMGIVRTTFIFNEKGICTKVLDKVISKNATLQVLQP